ncbi:hypothetical protein HELRODRAFT_179042 [Helobdella robusta]|uniref:Uncharacterized protein n=1 Tax=Helobdella robusta TaxID=6412 RepID=T1FE33_HELRO|nr:hypothetical protein HELRODRAFT_179042 [Helobdella robusta]ESN95848.1 hypothetical protein HELRODRAFT_179042 [Helobdella robusta]
MACDVEIVPYTYDFVAEEVFCYVVIRVEFAQLAIKIIWGQPSFNNRKYFRSGFIKFKRSGFIVVGDDLKIFEVASKIISSSAAEGYTDLRITKTAEIPQQSNPGQSVVLVRTISLDKEIRGVTAIRNQLFVVTANSPLLYSFNIDTYDLITTFNVKDVKNPFDLVSNGSDVLFISEWSMLNIHRVEFPSKKVSHITTSNPYSTLSINYNNNSLLAVSKNKNKISEYKMFGSKKKIKSVLLNINSSAPYGKSSHYGSVAHAINLTYNSEVCEDSKYLVCSTDNHLHIVDRKGSIQWSYNSHVKHVKLSKSDVDDEGKYNKSYLSSPPQTKSSSSSSSSSSSNFTKDLLETKSNKSNNTSNNDDNKIDNLIDNNNLDGNRKLISHCLNKPSHLTTDKNGFILVCDSGNDRVLLLNKCLEFVRELIEPGINGMKNPLRIFLDDARSRLYVVAGDLFVYQLIY